MDVLDLAILALRVVLVATLYLFLFLVVRVAWRGLQAAPRLDTASVRSHTLKLIVLDPGSSTLAAGQVVELAEGATLGRAERAGLVLADPAVSAEHAQLRRVGRAWMVSDLGSTNGTRVNDRRVNGETPLAHGDVLTVGTVRLQVRAR